MSSWSRSRYQLPGSASTFKGRVAQHDPAACRRAVPVPDIPAATDPAEPPRRRTRPGIHRAPRPQQTRRRNTVVNMRELTRLPPFGL